MRKLILLFAAMLVSTCTFAISTSDSDKLLKSLGSKFQSTANITAKKIDPKDITMGYAGQDLSDKNFIA